MKNEVETVKTYLASLPEERKAVMNKLSNLIAESLPAGFEEQMSNDTIGYVVPFTLYTQGYHCKPVQPLPFINLGSKKNFIVIHHLGLYASESLSKWFEEEYNKQCKTKIDMGKGCFRLKKMDDIPYALIAELCKKFTVDEWIMLYEKSFIKR